MTSPASPLCRFPVSVERTAQYQIEIQHGLLESAGERIRALNGSARAYLITDDTVGSLHGTRLLRLLRDVGFQCEVLTVPAGERSKSLSVAAELYQRLLSAGAGRRDLILALGGGVIMDLAGFVAATYMRGISYANIPTSLVAQLDAGIGGKVGVNHDSGKNLIGAFHHPLAVYIDPELLSTLAVADVKNGLAEAIKIAIIHSRELFEFIEVACTGLLEGNNELLTQLTIKSIQGKLELVSPDPFENDLKRALNFGHTIGHVLETLTDYAGLSHGQAISIGMAVATRLAVTEGLSPKVGNRILALLERAGLPTRVEKLDPKRVKDGLGLIESVRGRSLNFVVPTGIGSCAILSGLSFDLIIEHF